MPNIPSLQDILPCNTLHSRWTEWKPLLPLLQGMSCLHAEILVATATYSCVRWASVSPSTSPTTHNLQDFQFLLVPLWRWLHAWHSLTVKNVKTGWGPEDAQSVPVGCEVDNVEKSLLHPEKHQHLKWAKSRKLQCSGHRLAIFSQLLSFFFLLKILKNLNFRFQIFGKPDFWLPAWAVVSMFLCWSVQSLQWPWAMSQHSIKGKKKVWQSVTFKIVRPWEPNTKERRQVWQSVRYSLIGVRWLRKVHRIALVGCHSDCRNVRTL